MSDHHRRFPTTRWSLVRRAGEAEGNVALEELLRRYLPALRAHLQHMKRIEADEAENILQSFVLDKVVQEQLITRADRRRGRFRTFLLTVLDNYTRNWFRWAQAKRRSPDQSPASLESIAEPAQTATVDRAFDVAWAREVLHEALDRMESSCRENGHISAWEVFSARAVQPLLEGEPYEPYEQLVRRLGLGSPAEAHNALVTGKRMFQRALNEVIGEYASDPAEIEEEITDLYRALADRGT